MSEVLAEAVVGETHSSEEVNEANDMDKARPSVAVTGSAQLQTPQGAVGDDAAPSAQPVSGWGEQLAATAPPVALPVDPPAVNVAASRTPITPNFATDSKRNVQAELQALLMSPQAKAYGERKKQVGEGEAAVEVEEAVGVVAAIQEEPATEQTAAPDHAKDEIAEAMPSATVELLQVADGQNEVVTPVEAADAVTPDAPQSSDPSIAEAQTEVSMPGTSEIVESVDRAVVAAVAVEVEVEDLETPAPEDAAGSDFEGEAATLVAATDREGPAIEPEGTVKADAAGDAYAQNEAPQVDLEVEQLLAEVVAPTSALEAEVEAVAAPGIQSSLPQPLARVAQTDEPIQAAPAQVVEPAPQAPETESQVDFAKAEIASPDQVPPAPGVAVADSELESQVPESAQGTADSKLVAEANTDDSTEIVDDLVVTPDTPTVAVEVNTAPPSISVQTSGQTFGQEPAQVAAAALPAEESIGEFGVTWPGISEAENTAADAPGQQPSSNELASGEGVIDGESMDPELVAVALEQQPVDLLETAARLAEPSFEPILDPALAPVARSTTFFADVSLVNRALAAPLFALDPSGLIGTLALAAPKVSAAAMQTVAAGPPEPIDPNLPPGERLAQVGTHLSEDAAKLLAEEPGLGWIWWGEEVPLAHVANEVDIQTPSVGRVRIVLQSGDYVEGLLHAVGQSLYWIDGDLGRYSVDNKLVSHVERLPKPGLGATVAGLQAGDLVRVKLRSGYVEGRLISVKGDKILVETDGGMRMTLDNTEIERIGDSKTRVVLP